MALLLGLEAGGQSTFVMLGLNLKQEKRLSLLNYRSRCLQGRKGIPDVPEAKCQDIGNGLGKQYQDLPQGRRLRENDAQ